MYSLCRIRHTPQFWKWLCKGKNKKSTGYRVRAQFVGFIFLDLAMIFYEYQELGKRLAEDWMKTSLFSRIQM